MQRALLECPWLVSREVVELPLDPQSFVEAPHQVFAVLACRLIGHLLRLLYLCRHFSQRRLHTFYDQLSFFLLEMDRLEETRLNVEPVRLDVVFNELPELVPFSFHPFLMRRPHFFSLLLPDLVEVEILVWE